MKRGKESRLSKGFVAKLQDDKLVIRYVVGRLVWVGLGTLACILTHVNVRQNMTRIATSFHIVEFKHSGWFREIQQFPMFLL